MGTGRVLFGIVAALLLLGLLAGVGWYGYNAGVAQGMVASGQFVAPAPGTIAPVPYTQVWAFGPYGFHRGFGFGFGFLGCLVPLLFFFLIFALLRGAFFGRRWGWGGPGMHGYRGWDPSRGDIPPTIKDWHRKLHEEESNPPPPPASGAA